VGPSGSRSPRKGPPGFRGASSPPEIGCEPSSAAESSAVGPAADGLLTATPSSGCSEGVDRSKAAKEPLRLSLGVFATWGKLSLSTEGKRLATCLEDVGNRLL
jgi:hypothetical protein